jgi:hypothetical protein
MPSFARRFSLLAAILAVLAAPCVFAQDTTTLSRVSVVPHVVKYSGAMPNAPAAASVVEVRFAMYAAQSGGESLWTETQQVALDPQSKYSVLLGATTPAGLPQNLFANGESRWLGVTLAGQEESSRTLLAATPYSLKASDAETLGGHPATDFELKNAKPEAGVDITQVNAGTGITVTGNGTATVTVGINSTYLDTLAGNYAALNAANTFTASQTIAGNLAVSGAFITPNGTSKLARGGAVDITFANGVYTIGLDAAQGAAFGNSLWAQLAAANTFKAQQTLGTLGTATTAAAFDSNALKLAGSVYSSTASAAEAVNFLWQVEPSGNNTAAASGSLNLLASTGTATPAETGLKVATTGKITFASGQTFPGVPTDSGNNTFTGNQIINGTDTISGSAAGNGSYTAGQLTVTDTNTGATAVAISGNGGAVGVVGNGNATTGIGVQGQGDRGVYGVGSMGDSTNYPGEGVGVFGGGAIGVLGEGLYNGSTKPSVGVEGLITNPSPSGIAYGVYGLDQTGTGYYGVAGQSNRGVGTAGFSTSGNGVYGQTAGINGAAGVTGNSTTTTGGASGVAGTAVGASNAGVYGSSTGANGFGVFGNGGGTGNSVGVFGQGSTGVSGSSTSGNGVYGTTSGGNGAAGVSGNSSTTTENGSGVAGTAVGAYNAGVYGSATGSHGFGIFGNGGGTGGSVGVLGQTADSAGYGLSGSNTASSGYGVYGTGVSGGVYGFAGTRTGYGVQGVGISLSATGASQAGNGAGVYGDTSVSTNLAGVAGSSDDNNGGVFFNNSTVGDAALQASSFSMDMTPGDVSIFNASTPYLSKACNIDGGADLTCTGTISGSNVTAVQRHVLTYAVQSAENWTEDAGGGKLSGGHAHIALEAQFAQVVNTADDYHVFLTPEGDCKGLYVANKEPSGFDVRELGGGTANVPFSYRIMAKRLGHEKERLADVTEREETMQARLQHRFAAHSAQDARALPQSPREPAPETRPMMAQVPPVPPTPPRMAQPITPPAPRAPRVLPNKLGHAGGLLSGASAKPEMANPATR